MKFSVKPLEIARCSKMVKSKTFTDLIKEQFSKKG
jgi:hypothetical protein